MKNHKWYEWIFIIAWLLASISWSIYHFLEYEYVRGVIWALIFIVSLSILIASLHGNKSQTQQSNTSITEDSPLPSNQNRNIKVDSPFSVSIKAERVEKEPVTPHTISYLDLGHNPSGGYMSCAKYKVSGINPKTNRKNTRIIVAHNKDNALKQMDSMGFKDNQVKEAMVFDPPTDRQISYATDLGAIFPEDICKADASAIISRLTDYYSTPYLNIGFAKYLQENDIQFSAFAHPMEILYTAVYSLSKRERLIMYICSVYQNYYDNSLLDCDPRTLPVYEKAQTIADSLMQDTSIMNSFEKRDPSDYITPRKGTKIHTAIIQKLI